jgi:hypothetical protein
MSATKKVSTLQRLARVWEDSVVEPDAADMGTAFGLDCSLAALEHEGRDDDARAAAASCWPDGANPSG